MTKALEGIRVLDLARVIAGPHCSMVLADLGADVVKVEKKGEGDMSRANYPKIDEESTYFISHNRNKKSITLDFRSEEGKALLEKLIASADVLVENFRAGTMESMGFGFDRIQEINPRMILTRISGFGQDGPYSHRTCFDGAAQAMSGMMSITGMEDGPPTMIGTYAVDCATGLYAAIGTLAALNARQHTGRGQVVDVSLLDTAVSFMHTAITDYFMLGEEMGRIGNKDRYAWPANVYASKDGKWVYIHAGMDNTFAAIAKIMGKEDLLEDPRFKTRDGRAANIAEVDNYVKEWALTLPASEIIDLVSVQGIPCAPVNEVSDMVEDPQVLHRKMVAKINHPAIGELTLPGTALKLSDTPADVYLHPPALGENNDEIYRDWLSLSPEEIARFKADGVI